MKVLGTENNHIYSLHRVMHATKRKAQAAPKSPPKLAKVEEDPIYDDDDDTAADDQQQDPFDEYMDGNGGGEDVDHVAESDVRDESEVKDSRHEVSEIGVFSTVDIA